MFAEIAAVGLFALVVLLALTGCVNWWLRSLDGQLSDLEEAADLPVESERT